MLHDKSIRTFIKIFPNYNFTIIIKNLFINNKDLFKTSITILKFMGFIIISKEINSKHLNKNPRRTL